MSMMVKVFVGESEFDGAGTKFSARCREVTAQPPSESRVDVGSKGRSRSTSQLIAVFAAAATMLAASACGNTDSKTYDISPIFPLSSDKCAKYDGRTEGTGLAAHCWVTKDKCKQAASDWQRAVQSGGVSDAIQFSCD